MKFQVKNIGLIGYQDGLEFQEEIHKKVLEKGEDTIILCEHPHVYTFGKSADRNNLLISKNFLENIDAEVFETERGGDITYHGPGQLVGYPIINLRNHGVGVKKYVEILESSLIKALSQFEIEAFQINGLTGIWVGTENEIKRKIGAIGIRVKEGVSMHGFALNVSTNLKYFNHIVPCGITDKQVTSIEREVGNISIAEFSKQFILQFEKQWKNVLALH
ncbi:MAG: lipoyl(octanoyl) transferase LipB [Bacteroidia bacterium]|nr:lipoyl(octanoyl) transferase LipB [Bacteroidia bacterium]NNJ55233.1 lipoyl(octanoyl) transferase LipB [Bacteroidia bacterium]